MHFLALGAVLFAVFTLAEHRAKPPSTANRIFITPQVMEGLVSAFERSSGHAPSAGEKQTLLDDYVREEVLVREARALGLDRDDPVVRGALRRRMELWLENNAASAGRSVPQHQAAIAAAYQQLRARYEIVLEKTPGPAAKSP